MFTCFFCGWQASNAAARVCADCGPSKNWPKESVDQPGAISNYVDIIREFFFDNDTAHQIDRLTLRARERLKISLDTHRDLLAKLEDERDAMSGLSQFRLEFDANVVDAFAGHDTYLRFRFTNLSDSDLYKVSLDWDDPELPDDQDLHILSKASIKPGASSIFGGSHVFSRMGIKEIADLRVTVTNQFQESACFRAGAFTFKVGNSEQRVTNLTHNQISIEGRGVVDASGMGAQQGAQSGASDAWIDLPCTYIASDSLQTVTPLQSSAPEVKEAPAASEEIEAKAAAASGGGVIAEADQAVNPEDKEGLRRQAEQGNREAQFLLGLACAEGRDVLKDPLQALVWFKRAADSGCPKSQNYLGYMYNTGSGVTRDDSVALHWFRQSALQGLAKAQANLGVMYENGFGTAQDYRAAAEWYLKAALQGNASGQVALGLLYEDGNGIPADPALAADWFAKAADQGDLSGLYNLGRCQLYGTGVKLDPAKAVSTLRKGADAGEACSQYLLATCLQAGNGVQRDLVEAVRWHTMAAMQGDVDSQHCLGRMYWIGEGVEADDALARSWLQKAADQGHEAAINDIREMDALASIVPQPAAVAGKTIRDDVKDLVQALSAMAVTAGTDSSTSVIYDADVELPEDLRETLFLIVPDPDREDVVGLLVDDGDTCVHADGKLISFSGKFTVFTSEGYTWGHTDDDGDLLVEGQNTWQGAAQHNLLDLWRFRHAELSYTVYLGNQAHNNYLPGSRFECSHLALADYLERLLEAKLALKTLLFHAAFGISPPEDIEFDGGLTYSGEVDADNNPFGFGVMLYTDGSSFSGLFDAGDLVIGTHHYLDGGTSMAEFSGQLRDGLGVQRFAGQWAGHAYFGEYSLNKRHGDGVYYYPDGTIQVGQFENEKFVG